jgi:HD-like signal output (HDOD) protein
MPAHTAPALEATLASIDIPPCPAILGRIRAEMASDTMNFHRLSELICADVALAAGLLKTANSSFFGARNRARTVNGALLMLGLDVTCQAVATLGIRRAFPANVTFNRFWDASAKIATLTGWLSGRLDACTVRAENAYTYGLFRDCGIAVLLHRIPGYEAVLRSANADPLNSFTDAERSRLPTDHALLGSLLAQDWWLPDSMCQAIRSHHDPEALDGSNPTIQADALHLMAVGQLAEYLLQQTTGESMTEEWSKLGTHCLTILNLTPDDLPALCTEAALVLEGFEVI